MKKHNLCSLGICAIMAAVLAGCGTGAGNTAGGATGGSAAAESSADSEVSAAEADTANAEEPSSETEAAENEDAKVTEEAAEAFTEIINNGGHFTKAGSKVYFRQPELESMNEPELWGNYVDIYTGPSTICTYDTETGEISELFADNGYGAIVLSGEYLLLQEQDEDGDSCVILKDMQGNAVETYSGASLCGAEGDLAVISNFDRSSQALRLDVIKDGKLLESISQEAQIACYIGICGDNIIYESIADGEEGYTNALWSHKLSGDSETELGTIPGLGEINSAYGNVDQFLAQDGKIYIGLGFYEGTGHFYSGAYFMTADPEVPGSLTAVNADDVPEAKAAGQNPAETVKETESETEKESESAEAGETDKESKAVEKPDEKASGEGDDLIMLSKTPAFIIVSGEFRKTEGIPNTAAVNDTTGWIGYYDNEGIFVPIAEGYETVSGGEPEIRYNAEVTELVDGDIFIRDNYELRAEEADIGWREAYKRVSTYMRVINAETGEYKILTERVNG
ncbi:MAG: hypothetical protein Q4E57_01160 [Eubacteriales bacterium]|nr:hypothetical protein [Eubacteriales bacterium]